MNKLKNDIETVKKCIRQTRRQFLVVLREVMKMIRAEEGIEHRLSTLQESYTTMDKRLTGIEEYVHNMADHLNGAIERINAIHMYLKEKEEAEQSLRCYEALLSSDEEFDFDDMDPVFEKMKNNDQS